MSEMNFTWNKSSQKEKTPSSLVTPEQHGEEKTETQYTNSSEPLMSAVKLQSTSLHHTQEVKCQRRREAHRLSDL